MKWQIPYAGTTWEFDDARLTASEARMQKRLTDGLTPTVAESKRLELDPDSWLAALCIARRRTGLDAAEAMDVDLDELDLMQVMSLTKQALLDAGGDQKQRKPRRKPTSEESPVDPPAAA